MSYRITNDGIAVTQGDSIKLPVTFHNVDITGAVLKMQVRSSDLKEILIDKKITEHVDSKNGKTILFLTAEDTNLPVGEYVTDMEILFPDGQNMTFYPEKVGKKAFFKVSDQITKEA